MTDDHLDAIEAQVRAGGFTSIEANRNLIALVAEVRRLRAELDSIPAWRRSGKIR